MKRHSTLRAQVLLITASLVVAVVGVVLAIVAWIVRDQTAQTAQTASSRAKAVLAQTVSDQLGRLSLETSLIVDLPTTKSITNAPDSATIAYYLDKCRKQIGVDWILWTDADGVAYAESDRAGFSLGADLSSNRSVKAALAGRSWRGTTLRNGRVEFAACQPVVIGEYVKATMTVGKVLDEAMLQRIADAAQLEIVVFAGSEVVASTLDVRSAPDATDELQRVEVRGESFVGGYLDLPGSARESDLRLLALTPESAVTAPFAPLRQSLVALLLGGLAAAVWLGLSLSHRLTKPLDELMAAAKELQEGRWPEPFQPTRRDEIGFLQGHFDAMTVSLRQNRERLVSMLEIDPLTELWNHRSFKQKLQAMVDFGDQDVSVILLDIDEFEKYNQKFGHDRGDAALVSIARIVSSAAGDGAVCGRYGGNVFAVACMEADTETVAETMRLRIADETDLTVSAGYCRYGDSTQRPDVLLLAAQMAVGQAKSGGRNRSREFLGFDLAADEESLRRLLRGGSYAAVRALAEAVDAKDKYTHGHSQRVAEYAKSLAQASGLDSGFVELVFVAGTLHDVGKIGVPDDVLKKTSRLTDEEFAQVKLHPELGERIVMHIPELRDTLPGIRNHHERYDGKGYPDGLAGEHIPLIARILSVADAFDAMTSDRSYRQNMSFDTALDQLREGAGTQFDPVLAKTFVAVMDERRMAA